MSFTDFNGKYTKYWNLYFTLNAFPPKTLLSVTLLIPPALSTLVSESTQYPENICKMSRDIFDCHLEGDAAVKWVEGRNSAEHLRIKQVSPLPLKQRITSSKRTILS